MLEIFTKNQEKDVSKQTDKGENAIINATYKRAIQELYAQIQGKKNEIKKLLLALGMEMTEEVCGTHTSMFVKFFGNAGDARRFRCPRCR